MKKYDKDSLVGFLEAFDEEDLPDGAWFARLEEGGRAFIKEFKLKNIDENDLVHEYLQAK